MKNIFEEFPAPSQQKWLELVEKELKRTPEPLEIEESIWSDPFLEHKFEDKTILKKNSEGWLIFQKILISENAQDQNSEVLSAINGGASALHLVFDNDKPDFKEIFKNVDLKYITLSIEAEKDQAKILKILDDYCFQTYGDSSQIEIITSEADESKFIAIKPLQLISESPGKSLFENLSEILSEAEKAGIIDGNPFWIKLSSSENFYLNIAKIRALKILWEHILEANNTTAPEMRIWVQVGTTNPDPNQAAISATQQAAAAISGSADAIEINTLEYSSDYPQGFAERITRNIQNLLWYESHLNKVDDPAAGSYFIEDLTEKIKNEIWNLFLKNR